MKTFLYSIGNVNKAISLFLYVLYKSHTTFSTYSPNVTLLHGYLAVNKVKFN
jgi:hypothetical protein